MTNLVQTGPQTSWAILILRWEGKLVLFTTNHGTRK